MEITNFVVTRRNDALLVGDYGTYRGQLSRRLLTLRRRLGRTTAKGKKYIPKEPVNIEDLSKDPDHVYLLILAAERAWAHAMYMKSMHAADSSEKAITGSTKKHIVSRLRRANEEATRLVSILEEAPKEGFSANVLLEARAYQSMLFGSLNFEAQKWERSLAAYSNAYCAYRALSRVSAETRGAGFQELLSSTIEPSLRYAAYQLRLPRTLSIQRIAARYAQKDSTIVRKALELDPTALDESTTQAKQSGDAEPKDVPRTITWRNRKVDLEDASIAQSLAEATAAEQPLAEALSNAQLEREEQAAAFDGVLTHSQDAVNATVTAMSELTADGVAPGDTRMQALQVTRTAVNYALVGWRIGRNRVLCGRDDGAHIENEVKRRKKSQDGSKKVLESVEEQSTNKKLTRLRERVALLDSSLQSLESIQQLPGVAADSALLKELASRRAYFAAIRCLNVAHSHAILGQNPQALALYNRAHGMIKTVVADTSSTSKAPNLNISEQQVQFMNGHLQALTHQYRALTQLTKNASASLSSNASTVGPWVEHLEEYPAAGTQVDLTHLVDYPPRLRPVPVKPIFLDMAYNYLDYPGGKPATQVKKPTTTEEPAQKADGKRGWFGFGRS